MRKCSKCTLPETYETIEFDERGVCNICRQQEYKQNEIDWSNRKKKLGELIEKYRGKSDYDCIIPFSGGKDSTYTLAYLMKEYGVKPLVVRFNHGLMRPKLEEYTTKTLKYLGCDSITFTPNWKIVKKLMMESLVRKGDFCWHCHTGIFSYPMQIGIKFNVPLIFWGEPSSEYTAYYDYKDDQVEMVDEKRFNRFVNLGINAEDMYGMINTNEEPIDPRDLIPYTYPNVKELRKLKYNSVCLGSYIPWNVQDNVNYFQEFLPWWQGDEVEGIPFDKYPYEKIECYMQGLRDYIKYIKRGYARTTQMTSIDVRHDRMTREDALNLINQFEGRKPNCLPLFLDYLGITEKEFNDICINTSVPPYQHDFEKCSEFCNRPKDFNLWHREKNGVAQ